MSCARSPQPDDLGRVSAGDHLAVLGGGERLAAAGVQNGALVQGLADLAGVAGARSHVPGAHRRAAQPAGPVVVDVPAGTQGLLSPRACMSSNLCAFSGVGPLYHSYRERSLQA